MSPENPALEHAGTAVRSVLLGLLRIMQSREPLVVRGDDPEDLHRFRVALRRTRSCIGQLKRALPADRVAAFKPEFAWLGSVTGPARDLDVFLHDMRKYRKRLEADSRDDLDPLFQWIRSERRKAQEELVAQFASPRYRSLMNGWRDFLVEKADGGEAPEAGRPVVEFATQRIRARYRRMGRRGRRIDAAKATRRLHRLRIDGKKLRYLLEFFRDRFPRDEVEPLIRALKRLQNRLGSFNDLLVQQQALAAWLALAEEDAVPAGTIATVGRMLEMLAGEEREWRASFAGEFERFHNEENARRIARLAPVPLTEADR